MPIRGILLMAVIFPSLPVCFVRPFYGIILWTIIAFTSLQWYAYSAFIVPWALVVAIPTIAGSVLFAKGWRNVLSYEVAFLVILWLWFSFTTAVDSTVPLFADHVDDMMDKWTFVTKVLFMSVIMIAAVDSFARLRKLVLVIAACFGYFILKALPWLILTGGGERVYGPEKSMISDNNDFGLALNMTLPLYFFLAQSESNKWIKRFFWGMTLATIPAIFFTYSRGALVGLIAIIGLMFLQLKQKRILIPVFVLGLAVAVLFAPEGWKRRMDPTNDNAMDGSAYSRINAWTFCWHLASDYPLTGGGFQTFTNDLFARYAPNALDVHGPHSIYFGVLAEHGFIGLFLYLLLVGGCFYSAHWVVKWARFHGDEVAANYANMFRFSLVGFLMSGFFLGRAYFDYYYTIVACIVVLRRICATTWRTEANDTTVEEAEVPVVA